MSAEASDEKRSRGGEALGDESRPAKKAACAGMSGKVGTGKAVEEFRNYENSDRHTVRSQSHCAAWGGRGAHPQLGGARLITLTSPWSEMLVWLCRWSSATTA